MVSTGTTCNIALARHLDILASVEAKILTYAEVKVQSQEFGLDTGQRRLKYWPWPDIIFFGLYILALALRLKYWLRVAADVEVKSLGFVAKPRAKFWHPGHRPQGKPEFWAEANITRLLPEFLDSRPVEVKIRASRPNETVICVSYFSRR